jgi:hypothetical protein
VKGQLDFPDGLEEDYELASREFNLEQARMMLERLYGMGLERIAEAGEGDCADCDRSALLLAYGSVKVCRRCALLRRRAATRPRPAALSASMWTGWRRVRKGFVRDPDGVDHPPRTRKRQSPPPTWEYWRREAAA